MTCAPAKALFRQPHEFCKGTVQAGYRSDKHYPSGLKVKEKRYKNETHRNDLAGPQA